MLQLALARERSSSTVTPSSSMRRSPLAHIAIERRNNRLKCSEPATSTELSASIVNATHAHASSVVNGARSTT